MKIALPGETSHSLYANSYDTNAYKRLSPEFNVSPNTDWRQNLDHGWQGLGSYSQYMYPSGAHRFSSNRPIQS